MKQNLSFAFAVAIILAGVIAALISPGRAHEARRVEIHAATRAG